VTRNVTFHYIIACCLANTGRRKRGWDGHTLQMTQDTRDHRSLDYDSHKPECSLAIPQDFLRLPSLIPQVFFSTELL